LEKQCVENQVIWGVNFIINKITKHTFWGEWYKVWFIGPI
jgi:hypothetical protein